MARSTSEMAVCCSMRSVTRSCGSEPVLISVDTLVHAEQFLGLDGEGSITAPAAVRDSSHGRPNRRCGQTSNVCWANRSLVSSVPTTETLEAGCRAYDGNEAPDDLGRKSPRRTQFPLTGDPSEPTS